MGPRASVLETCKHSTADAAVHSIDCVKRAVLASCVTLCVRGLGLQLTRLLHAMPANTIDLLHALRGCTESACLVLCTRQVGTLAQGPGIARLLAGLQVLVGLQASFQPPSAQLTAVGTMCQQAVLQSFCCHFAVISRCFSAFLVSREWHSPFSTASADLAFGQGAGFAFGSPYPSSFGSLS